MSNRFENKKTYINVATVGHVDHGKTTLSAAIATISSELYGEKSSFNKKFAYDEIDNTREERERGITINSKSIPIETAHRVASLTDCPGHAGYVKNTSAGAHGIDVGACVATLTDGMQEQTKEHATILDRVRPESLILTFTKKDLVEDADLAEMAKEETMEMFKDLRCSEDPSKKLFKPENIYCIDVSALKALEGDEDAKKDIKDLLDIIDKCAIKERDLEAPFILPVGDIASVQGRGMVASGVVEQGRVEIGQELEVFTKKKGLTKYVVTSIQTFHHDMESAEAGQNVALLLRGAKKEDVHRGDVIAAPGLIKPASKFRALVYMLDPSKREGGRRKPIKEGFSPHFFMRCQHVTGKMTGFYAKEDPAKKVPQASAGERVIIEVDTLHPCFLQKDLGITIREGKDGTIASGRIIEVM
ncbi:MAG: GTP-binding protein [Cytophagales bacterium]